MARRAGTVVSTVTGIVIAAVVAAIIVDRERTETGPSSGTAGASVAVSTGARTTALSVATEGDAPQSALRREESVDASAGEPTDAAEWDERYRTEDLFSFAQSAAVAAISGDGRAAWLLSGVLTECKVLIASADRRDPALRGSLAERRVDDLKIQRCDGFRAAHPLDELQLPEDAMRPGYWRELAIAAGDSRALASRAVMVASALNDDVDAATRANQLALIKDDLRVAVATKDAEAIATLANVFLQPNVSGDALQGAAWILAACELGYDCSQTNPSRGHACVQSGTCNGTTLADEIRSSVSAGEFAKAYAAGQDIAYNIRQGDWEGLQPYLVMRP